MTYVKHVGLACPVCAVYNVHLELVLSAENVSIGLPGAQVKLSAQLVEIPVLRCYESSQNPEDYGTPCGWALEGALDDEGVAVFQNPAQP